MTQLVARPVATQMKCKLCSHARRPEIDLAIADLANRAISINELLARLADIGVENPTYDNVKAHRKSHLELVPQAVAEAEADVEGELKRAALAIFERILGADWRSATPTAEQYLELVRALQVHELELKIRAGLPTGITVDQGLKSIGETTKRKHEEGQSELFKSLGAGLTGAFRALGAKQQAELEPAVVEGEFEELPSGG